MSENVTVSISGYSDAMIDLELLGLDYGRPILQIGLCLFNLLDLEDEYKTYSFSVRVDTTGNNNVCPETQAWWLKTDAELLQELLQASAAEGQELPKAIGQLTEVLSENPGARIWADYPAFDIAHLQHAMQKHGIHQAWSHRSVHGSTDVRLLCRIFLGEEDRAPVHEGRREHEARSDALQQAMELKAWIRQLKNAIPGAQENLASFLHAA